MQSELLLLLPLMQRDGEDVSAGRLAYLAAMATIKHR